MPKYKILTTEQFDRDFEKLDKSLQMQVAKEIEKLAENPFSGKPLGYKFFREKKIGNYRFYYLIYENEIVVFVIAISTKKDQQTAINTIKKL